MESHTVDREKNEKNENLLETVQQQPWETDFKSQDTSVFASSVRTKMLQNNESLIDEKSGEEEGDHRNKIKEALFFLRMVYKKLLREQSEETEKGESIGSQVLNILKAKGKCVDTDEQIIGAVPGIEVGDRFQFRLELSFVGIHCQAQSGVAYLKNGEDILVTSVLTFGGCTNDLHNPDFIFYRTEDYEEPFDNSFCLKNDIRVIYSVEFPSSSSSCGIAGYVYDGLYVVKNWTTEVGPKGKVVCTYELQRKADQPELGSKFPRWTRLMKCVLRDISRGREMIPIPAIGISTRENDVLPQFEYVIDMLYPDWFSTVPRKGCDCTHGCSNSRKCTCVAMNGGELPYNHYGAIIKSRACLVVLVGAFAF